MTDAQKVLQECACHRVRTAARAITRTYDDALRPAGLRATQLAVLVAVAGDDAISITALANLMGMDRSTLTRTLRPLEADGLIAIGVEGWRRSRGLEITKKGRVRLQEALPLWQKAQQSLRRKLGERRWDLLRTDLDELIRVA